HQDVHSFPTRRSSDLPTFWTMNGVTQPKTPPRFLVMFGKNALLVGVPERSQVAAAGAALALRYGARVTTRANSKARTSTPIDYDLGAEPWSKMMFERVTPVTGIGVEPAPAQGTAASAAIDAPSPAMRLQILSTEHWSLLASRSLAWNESFSRAGMFLSTLSGAIVALGLVGGATGFGESFTLFALVILPVVQFIGLATWIRLGASNYHEALCVIGMNRIRAAYLQLAPDLERFFVMSAHDDFPGIGVTMGVQPGGGSGCWLAQMLAGTPTVVAILNAVLVGAILAIGAVRWGGSPTTALLVGGAGFVVAVVFERWYVQRGIDKLRAGLRPLFPTPEKG